MTQVQLQSICTLALAISEECTQTKGVALAHPHCALGHFIMPFSSKTVITMKH